APREHRSALPPAHPPAPERADRGRRAAPRDARPDAADAGAARASRARPYPLALDPPRLARRLVPDPPRAVLRLGPAHELGTEHRARDPHRRRPALLVADRERTSHAGDGDRLSRRRLRRLVVPRPRLHLLEHPVLQLLRARAAAVGTVAGARPESRGHLHERRADARLPPHDRL